MRDRKGKHRGRQCLCLCMGGKVKMNKIIESFLNTHIREYSIEEFEKEIAFEHFINRCIINKYSVDRFDPMDIMTDEGEKGIDGIAIVVNDRIITTMDEADSIAKNNPDLDVKFVFIQSKTSDKFSGDEIGTFIYGVKAFFEEESMRPKTNEKMEKMIAIKDLIYQKSIDMVKNPELDLYYVCCGKWDDNNGLQNRIDIEIKSLVESQNFSNIEFYKYDSDKISIAYKELKKKVSRTFIMERRISFPDIKGAKQSFLGIVSCQQFISLLTDNDGKMLTNIFEDNVRDFQGYNPVNNEIRDTINDTEDQKRFALLNNGITIVAKKVDITGDNVEIYDYQIVNGCQTSYVLFDNREMIKKGAYIIVKVIEVLTEELSDRVIYTTNRQTEVKSEAFTSTKHFHKELQDYYNALVGEFGLYYERRSKQYDMQDNIRKANVVSLATQTASYVATFLSEPQSTHRYYGELLNAYKNRLYLDTDASEPYYIAAYFNFFLDKLFKEGKIEKKYRIFKFHLMLGMKILMTDTNIIYGKARQQKKICEKIFRIIRRESELQRYFETAFMCLQQAISDSRINDEDQHRSKEFTTEYILLLNKQKNAVDSTEYLKKGDVVHCTASSVLKNFVHVEIKTQDTRNIGQIHISKLTEKRIKKCEDAVEIGDIFQAKIISDDYFDSKYGWSLTRIF